MGAAAQFNVSVRGQGGHAAMPHTTVDPVVAGAAVVTALQVFHCPVFHCSVFHCHVFHCPVLAALSQTYARLAAILLNGSSL